MRIKVRDWRVRVHYQCRHALYDAGYRTVRNLEEAKITELLSLPCVDANDVATILTLFYEANCEPVNPDYSLARQELAEFVEAFCSENNLEPETLLNMTVAGAVALSGISPITIPPLVRKIKHMMLGKPDPSELLKIPPYPKKKEPIGTWWKDKDLKIPSWAEELHQDYIAALQEGENSEDDL